MDCLQSELNFSPKCLVGSAEVILPVCGGWVTGHKEFSLMFEYCLLEYEHSNARATCEVCQVMAERERFSFKGRKLRRRLWLDFYLSH